jgi:hypothetical protein
MELVLFDATKELLIQYDNGDGSVWRYLITNFKQGLVDGPNSVDRSLVVLQPRTAEDNSKSKLPASCAEA